MSEQLFPTGAPTQSRIQAPFTASQRQILRVIAETGEISSTDAGKIIHACRQPPCRRCREGRCPYVSSDGGDAMKRLMARRIVKRTEPGRWVAIA